MMAHNIGVRADGGDARCWMITVTHDYFQFIITEPTRANYAQWDAFLKGELPTLALGPTVELVRRGSRIVYIAQTVTADGCPETSLEIDLDGRVAESKLRTVVESGRLKSYI